MKSGSAIAVAVLGFLLWQYWPATPAAWTDEEVAVLRSLWLETLPELPPDPSNAVADDAAAVLFGAQLFVDTRLSSSGGISCATCHQAERRFSDGLQKGQGIGRSRRNTPSIVGSAYSPWLYWDGRRDSQWSQALSPLEDPNEHGSDRDQIARLIEVDKNHRASYESLFGVLPTLSTSGEREVTTVFSNVGKAIAAFERTLMPTTSRFDQYVSAVIDEDVAAQRELFSGDEIRGLRLFIGDANCTQCHNGPLFSNHEFHNTGIINFPGEVPDKGRAVGVREVLENEFNCLGAFGDDASRDCSELQFVRTGVELLGAMRTPSLRNLEGTDPYMHKGQIATLMAVLEHYNDAPDAMIGHNEAKPLALSSRQLRQLEAFLHTLAAPVGGDASTLLKRTTSSL